MSYSRFYVSLSQEIRGFYPTSETDLRFGWQIIIEDEIAA
jgi:hypothetical protein